MGGRVTRCWTPKSRVLPVSVAGQSGSQVVAGRWHLCARVYIRLKSARSRPGPGGWGRRTAAKMGPPGAWALVAAEGSLREAFCEVNRFSLPLRVRSLDRLHHCGVGAGGGGWGSSFQRRTSRLTLAPLCRKSSGEPQGDCYALLRLRISTGESNGAGRRLPDFDSKIRVLAVFSRSYRLLRTHNLGIWVEIICRMK